MSIQIRDFLRSDGSIIINKKLAKIIGLDATILYSELISKSIFYESIDKLDDDGFFFYTIEDMENDTTLSVRQQKKAINTLIELNLIEYKVKGVPPKRYFKLPDSEGSLMNILEESKNQFKQNAQIENAQNAQIKTSEMHKSNCTKCTTINNKDINNKNNNNKNITANADTPRTNTLFDLPQNPSKESSDPIEQARKSGNWKKVTDTEFVKYFIELQNELFPTQIQFVKSKETNYLVSTFRKNFIERYQIPKEEVCIKIAQLIEAYKETESDQRYRDCFSLETFRLDWKIDKLMNAVKRADKYGANRKLPKTNEEEQLIF